MKIKKDWKLAAGLFLLAGLLVVLTPIIPFDEWIAAFAGLWVIVNGSEKKK